LLLPQGKKLFFLQMQIRVLWLPHNDFIHKTHNVLLSSDEPDFYDKKTGKLVMNINTRFVDFFNLVFLGAKLEATIEYGDTITLSGNHTFTFHETARVLDDQKTQLLPPSLGTFDVKRVARNHFAIDVGPKKNPMWIEFGRGKSAVQVFARRHNAIGPLEGGESPNYCPVPQQAWLGCGTATELEFIVHPFVAKSVVFNDWLTGDSEHFTSTPRELGWQAGATVSMGPSGARTITLNVEENELVESVMCTICERLGFQPDTQRLLSDGKELSESLTLKECCLVDGSTLHLLLRKENSSENPHSPADYLSLENATRIKVDIL